MKDHHKKPKFLDGEFNLPKIEEKVLEYWDARKIFEQSLEQTRDGWPFTFYDGPPFATGLPHYGHILASTIKDLVPRYQTMKGRFVRRRWGWDCHGLPIEEIVERKLGISGKKEIERIGIKKFNETCRDTVLMFADEWGKTVRRIARWVEFDDSYKTMDTDYMESVWWAFKQIYDKKLAYEGRRVLLYCPRCETPVSNFEVAMDNSYKDVSEETVTVKFKLKASQKIGDHVISADDKVYVLAWTTTPWTLPGNVALAVGSDIRYCAVQHGEEYFIAAADRLKDLGLADDLNFRALTGAQLVGLEYEPLFDVPAVQFNAKSGAKSETAFKIYAADFVTTEDGTGVVHTAVVYGEDDYNLGVKVGLPIVPLLDERGIFNEKAPELVRGQYFKKANALVIADLENRKPISLIFKKEQHMHSYPFCWRCGTALFYNAIPAWFVNVQKIKSDLLKSNDREINWFPEHLKHGRYEKSVEAAPDWNISRNRYWGNPIPVWKCNAPECGHEEAIGSIDELAKKTGSAKNSYWVMRHGEAESNIFNIIDSGQRKYLHLTPRGKEQVEKSIEHFKKSLDQQGEKIDLIIASDVTRTKETEEIDASVLVGEEVMIDPRLEEIHLGPKFSGLNIGTYAAAFPTYRSRFAGRPEGGESLRDVRARLWDFLKDCEAKYAGKNILIVTHEYPAWMLTQIAEGWSERRAMAEKEKQDIKHGGGEGRGADARGEFIDFAEIRKLDLKMIPRNDGGEADLHRPYIDEITFPCAKCGGKDGNGGTMVRTPEIFDSWMEAGSMPFAEYHYPFENKAEFEKHFPAQFVAEYIAQTRAWFYVMHVSSFILFGKAPFDNVVTTGTILAEDGTKMSKSKGNFPDPWLLLNKYGADSLRFYLMGSVVMQADNLNFSEKGVESVSRKVGMLLANVYKFYETYAEEERGMKKTEEERKNEEEKRGGENVLDAWIGVRTDELVAEVTKKLDNYDTVRATRVIQEYVDDLSTWYLRRSRKRKDAGFLPTLRECLLQVSKVLAPFMPFMAEALYADLGGERESVHLEEWPGKRNEEEGRGMKKKKEEKNGEERKELLAAMAEVLRLASLGLAVRAAAKMKVRQPLAKMTVKNFALPLGGEFLDILRDEINVKEIIVDVNIENEVELDTALTPELRAEGSLREVARAVQELRQKAGFASRDRIALYLALPPEVAAAIMQHEAALKLDVGAQLVEYKRMDKFDAEEEMKMDGQAAWVGVRKI